MRGDLSAWRRLGHADPQLGSNAAPLQPPDRLEDGERILVVPSDKRDTAIKAYLLFELDSTQADSFDIPLVKVFANQAELIYHNLIRQNGGNSGGGKGKSSNEGPLDSLKKVTSSVIGQVR